MSRSTARTKDGVLQSLLDKIPDEYLKDVGTFTHDFNSSIAIEAQDDTKKKYSFGSFSILKI